MPRFFVENGNFFEDKIVMIGDELFHMSHTLRMKTGEKVTVCDSTATEFECEIESIEKQRATLRVLNSHKSENEPTIKVCLFQCVPKGDKMEYIVQKAVELGVERIVPVLSKNCVVKLDEKTANKKAERWGKIAKEAAKQCGRGIIPTVETPVSFLIALKQMKAAENSVIFYENATENGLHTILKKDMEQFCFMVGPEGGFTTEEIALSKAQGVANGTLGKRILRTETVAGMVLSVAMYTTGNL